VEKTRGRKSRATVPYKVLAEVWPKRTAYNLAALSKAVKLGGTPGEREIIHLTLFTAVQREPPLIKYWYSVKATRRIQKLQ
jgi:hypothetical protein